MATHDQQSFAGRVTESFRTVTGEWLSGTALLALISQGVQPVLDNVTVFCTSPTADTDDDATRKAGEVLRAYAERFGLTVTPEAIRRGVREASTQTNRRTGDSFESPRSVYLSLPLNSAEHVRHALLGSLSKAAVITGAQVGGPAKSPAKPAPALDDLPF